MPITINSTDTLSEAQKPSSSHTPAAVTALTGNKLVANYSHEIAASGVTDANPDTAFTNIVSALETWLTGTFLPGVKIDATADPDAVNTIKSLVVKGGDRLTSSTKTFVITGTVEVQ